MASLNPATRLGVHKKLGSLKPGRRADVLVLSKKLQVQRVFIEQQELAR